MRGRISTRGAVSATAGDRRRRRPHESGRHSRRRKSPSFSGTSATLAPGEDRPTRTGRRRCCRSISHGRHPC